MHGCMNAVPDREVVMPREAGRRARPSARMRKSGHFSFLMRAFLGAHPSGALARVQIRSRRICRLRKIRLERIFMLTPLGVRRRKALNKNVSDDFLRVP